MTDEQFERFMVKITRAQEDHDLLISIKTHIEMFTNQYHKTRDEDIRRCTTTERKTDAAHNRIDKLLIGSLVTVIVMIGGLIINSMAAFGK